ncbi:MAG: glycosyltransferase family 2 protein [Candidatus Moranbacteria bacterium]|nr:glycosyltransferase family 2 protein [Candidatus Moranbacteria bacterium]
MKNNNLISIMMPAFNAEKTILTALKSLQYQTYTNWECIIVNDGSTDKTLNILKSLNDKRFKIYSFTENKGRGIARQFALEKCKGEFIAMLDADDWYYHDKLEKQIIFLLEHPEIDLVSCGFVIQKNKTAYAARGIGESEIKTFKKPNKVPVPHASSLFKRKITINQTYDPNLKLGQDMDFLRHILIGRKYALLNFPGYVYDEYTSNNFKKINQSYLYSAKSYLKFIKKYPFTSLKNASLEYIKIIRLYIHSKLFGFNSLLEKRSQKITEEQRIEYNKNLFMLENYNNN